jgi:hypothetical protein
MTELETIVVKHIKMEMKKIILFYINNYIPTCHLSNQKLTEWSNTNFYD